jgi:uncharacterized NAD(P)/FAD-binding protein YdhS
MFAPDYSSPAATGSPVSGPTIAIVGAGFCGTLAAIWLMRGPLPPGARVILIDRPDRFGRGLAYQHGPTHWLLNVPAERMSPFTENPNDFLEWAQRRDSSIAAGDYLPRTWYGEYLQELLAACESQSPSGAQLDRVQGSVVKLVPHGARALLALDDGRTLRADRVVLALGNATPADPLPELRTLDAYVADPWRKGWIEALPEKARVVLLGTGLTTLDIALQVSQARPKSRLLAISRHGLLPREQQSPRRTPSAVPQNEILFSTEAALGRGALSLRLRRFRDFIARWTSVGGDWRAVVQGARDSFPALWRELGANDRKRFVRHLRVWWDVHRHRVPPRTMERIEALRRSGQLSIAAARLQDCRQDRERATLRWLPRGAKSAVLDKADAVVNCTGPEGNVRRSRCALIQSLIDQGLAQPDELGLGWQTAGDGRLMDAQGCASSLIYYVGPLLRASCWEATAVPELRAHVERTISAVLHSVVVPAVRQSKRTQPEFPRSRLLRRVQRFLHA